MKTRMLYLCIAIKAAMILNFTSLKAEELKSGDLIFVGASEGNFSQAIADATEWEETSMRFVHVGIIEVRDSTEINVIEASPQKGVRLISLDDFLAEAPLLSGRPAVAVKRCISEFPVEKTISNAKRFLGQPYDWWYMPDNGKIYCSELVFESFLDDNGNHIFESHPMNFKAKDGSIPQFWIDLFEEIGEPIPEGVEGTNPSDLSKSKNLRPVLEPFHQLSE